MKSLSVDQVLAIRLQNLGVNPLIDRTPQELCAHLGAIQAQDYGQSLLAIALRLPDYSLAEIRNAIGTGQVIRTWSFRGTIHLMAPEDVRGILRLVGPGILQSAKTRLEKMGLPQITLEKGVAVLTELLAPGLPLTRSEIASGLMSCGIDPSGQKLSHILFYSGFHEVHQQGPDRGKQVTYQQLNAPACTRSVEEVLAGIVLRYFASHGPASLGDLAWWMGIAKGLAKRGLDSIQHHLEAVNCDGETLWMLKEQEITSQSFQDYLFLGGFDEYVMGYKNRSWFLPEKWVRQVITVNGLFYPVIVHRNQIVGVWKRTEGKKQVAVEIKPFENLTPELHDAGEKFKIRLNEISGFR